MKLRLFPAIAALLLVPVVSSGQTANLPTLPEDLFPQLNQLLAAAVEQSPRMIALNMDREIADANYTQARARLLPSVSGSVTRSRTRDEREDRPDFTLETDKLYYSLGITQPLFHWGELRNNVRMAEISRQMTERGYAEGYRLLVQEIRLTYLQLIVLKARYAAIRLTQAQAEENLRAVEDRLARGVISDAEAFGPRLAAEQAVLNTDRTLDNYLEAKRRLALLTGEPAPPDDSIPANIPSLPAEENAVEGLLSGFLAQEEPSTVAALNLKDQITTARLNYENQRKRLLPKVNFVMGITQDEQSYYNISEKYGLQSQYAGIGVSWLLFDGFATRGAKKAALLNMRKTEAAYRNYSDDIGAQAQSAARHLEFSARQMRIQERYFDGNRSFLEHQQEQNRLGTVSAAALADAQVQYNNGLTQTLEARADYLNRISQFVGLVARDPAVDHLNEATP